MTGDQATDGLSERPEFAIVEMRGRRRFGAKLRTTGRWGIRGAHAEILGPEGSKAGVVQLLPAHAIFTVTLCTEEEARRVVPVDAVPFEMGERSVDGLTWPLDAFARQVQALALKDHGTPTVRGIVADLEAFVVAAKVALERGDEDAVAEMGAEVGSLAYALHAFTAIAF